MNDKANVVEFMLEMPFFAEYTLFVHARTGNEIKNKSCTRLFKRCTANHEQKHYTLKINSKYEPHAYSVFMFPLIFIHGSNLKTIRYNIGTDPSQAGYTHSSQIDICRFFNDKQQTLLST